MDFSSSPLLALACVTDEQTNKRRTLNCKRYTFWMSLKSCQVSLNVLLAHTEDILLSSKVSIHVSVEEDEYISLSSQVSINIIVAEAVDISLNWITLINDLLQMILVFFWSEYTFSTLPIYLCEWIYSILPIHNEVVATQNSLVGSITVEISLMPPLSWKLKFN